MGERGGCRARDGYPGAAALAAWRWVHRGPRTLSFYLLASRTPHPLLSTAMLYFVSPYHRVRAVVFLRMDFSNVDE